MNINELYSELKLLDHESFSRLGAELLGNGLCIKFRVSGHSMEPAIHENDTVTLEPAGDTAVGDIVMYKGSQGCVCLHRVIRVHPTTGSAYVGGDAPRAVHESVPLRTIVGKVSSIERNGKILPPATLAAPALPTRCRLRSLIRKLAGLWRTATNHPAKYHPPVP